MLLVVDMKLSQAVASERVAVPPMSSSGSTSRSVSCSRSSPWTETKARFATWLDR
jgi:hypothetical protein